MASCVRRHARGENVHRLCLGAWTKHGLLLSSGGAGSVGHPSRVSPAGSTTFAEHSLVPHCQRAPRGGTSGHRTETGSPALSIRTGFFTTVDSRRHIRFGTLLIV